jgi:hypothetical protein
MLPALCQLFHLVYLSKVGPLDVLDRLTGKHEEMAFTGSNRSTVPGEEPIFAEDINVTEMAALDVRNECDVIWPVELFVGVFTLFLVVLFLFVDNVLDVQMQLDLALLNEVKLFRVVPLLIQDVTFKEF